jgi:hypothetical protein
MIDPQESGGPLSALQAFTVGICGMFPTAMLARLLWHHRLVRMGQRRFWGRDLLWEVPTAAFSSILGSGFALLMIPFLPQVVQESPERLFMVTNTIVGLCAWMGPRGIEVLLSKLVENYAPHHRRSGEEK